MTNTHRKGDRIERKAKDELEEKDYLVEKPVRTKFSRKDFFNLFDLIAIKPNCPIRFIQIKGGSYSKEVVEDLADFGEKFLQDKYATVELWSHEDYKGFVTKNIMPEQLEGEV